MTKKVLGHSDSQLTCTPSVYQTTDGEHVARMHINMKSAIDVQKRRDQRVQTEGYITSYTHFHVGGRHIGDAVKSSSEEQQALQHRQGRSLDYISIRVTDHGDHVHKSSLDARVRSGMITQPSCFESSRKVRQKVRVDTLVGLLQDAHSPSTHRTPGSLDATTNLIWRPHGRKYQVTCRFPTDQRGRAFAVISASV